MKTFKNRLYPLYWEEYQYETLMCEICFLLFLPIHPNLFPAVEHYLNIFSDKLEILLGPEGSDKKFRFYQDKIEF